MSSASEVTDKIGGGEAVGCGMSDRMVNMEIEAAEALAGLAHSVSRGVNEDECSRGRPVKTDSVPLKSGSAAAAASDTSLSMLLTSGKEGAPPIVEQQYRNEEAKTTNGESAIKLSKSSVHLSVGKTRQNLDEAEKEARRLRRVLANRESARATIRRRQAHSKEMMEKAASLAWENEDLKKEKELVNQEYDNLKSINRSLKVQITKSGSNVEETFVEPKSTPPETSTSRSACHPPFRYNQPPIFWSPLIQLPNGSQNVSSEQEKCLKANDPGLALCVYPCAWFMPPIDHSNGPNISTSTKTIENHNHSLSMRLDAETSRKMENEGGKNIRFQTENEVPTPGKLKAMERGDKAAVCSTSKRTRCCPGKKQPANCSAVIKKKNRSEAAAEARKIRKELTKFKFRHVKRV